MQQLRKARYCPAKDHYNIADPHINHLFIGNADTLHKLLLVSSPAMLVYLIGYLEISFFISGQAFVYETDKLRL